MSTSPRCHRLQCAVDGGQTDVFAKPRRRSSSQFLAERKSSMSLTVSVMAARSAVEADTGCTHIVSSPACATASVTARGGGRVVQHFGPIAPSVTTPAALRIFQMLADRWGTCSASRPSSCTQLLRFNAIAARWRSAPESGQRTQQLAVAAPRSPSAAVVGNVGHLAQNLLWMLVTAWPSSAPTLGGGRRCGDVTILESSPREAVLGRTPPLTSSLSHA